MPVMTDTSLVAIRNKSRRLTRNPSENNLSTTSLDQFINTAILFDLPNELRLFNLRKLVTFYTQPNVDQYSTEETDPLNPLYDFKNRYIAVHPPLFIAGVQCFYTQQRDVFYGYYPQTQTIADTSLRGDGTTNGPFTGRITASPSIQESITFSCIDTNGTSMILTDQPTSNILGNLGQMNVVTGVFTVYGTINYITGAYAFSFPNICGTDATVWVENIGYQPGKPLAVLYYDDTFTIRPVPDKTYTVELEVDVLPTELLATGQSPELDQWWQYISYLTARLIFQDRQDIDSVNAIMPELKRQERLCLRTTLTQQANERTTTIYTQGKNYGFMGGWGAGGWPY